MTQRMTENPAAQLEQEKINVLHQIEEVTEALPGFTPQGEPIQLSGGLLNFVWRINGKPDSTPESLIAKWAPPVIASAPGVQLDPHRILIEAKVLEAFGPHGQLAELVSNTIRPPYLIDLDPSLHFLLMEDVCDCPDLSKWVQNPQDIEDAAVIGKNLGDFIGRLHHFSTLHPEFGSVFSNKAIQQTRLNVQYSKVFDYAKKARLKNASQIGSTALAFGELLQTPGTVLIMGDLWLPSIFVTGDKLRIIDWELSHYGRPSQDVGHLAAHLWMYQHRYPDSQTAENSRIIWENFLTAYRAVLADRYKQVFGNEGIQESAVHFGCEVLTRTVGSFQSGFLYEGLRWDHPAVQEAASIAAKHILDPFAQPTFKELI